MLVTPKEFIEIVEVVLDVSNKYYEGGLIDFASYKFDGIESKASERYEYNKGYNDAEIIYYSIVKSDTPEYQKAKLLKTGNLGAYDFYQLAPISNMEITIEQYRDAIYNYVNNHNNWYRCGVDRFLNEIFSNKFSPSTGIDDDAGYADARLIYNTIDGSEDNLDKVNRKEIEILVFGVPGCLEYTTRTTHYVKLKNLEKYITHIYRIPFNVADWVQGERRIYNVTGKEIMSREDCDKLSQFVTRDSDIPNLLDTLWRDMATQNIIGQGEYLIEDE